MKFTSLIEAALALKDLHGHEILSHLEGMGLNVSYARKELKQPKSKFGGYGLHPFMTSEDQQHHWWPRVPVLLSEGLKVPVLALVVPLPRIIYVPLANADPGQSSVLFCLRVVRWIKASRPVLEVGTGDLLSYLGGMNNTAVAIHVLILCFW